jgi:hypothetical protein
MPLFARTSSGENHLGIPEHLKMYSPNLNVLIAVCAGESELSRMLESQVESDRREERDYWNYSVVCACAHTCFVQASVRARIQVRTWCLCLRLRLCNSRSVSLHTKRFVGWTLEEPLSGPVHLPVPVPVPVYGFNVPIY